MRVISMCLPHVVVLNLLYLFGSVKANLCTSLQFFQNVQDKIFVLRYTKESKWQNTECECEPKANINFDAFCRHIQTTMEAKGEIDVPRKP